MALEAGTYISDLNSSNPAAGDDVSVGDDHIRLLKATILATFPNISGAVTPTHVELNYVDGVTSAIQTQIDLKAPLASPTFTGTLTAVTGAFSGYVTGIDPVSNAQFATKYYVDQQAFAAALPVQTGNAGKYVRTDGTNAAWVHVFGTASEISTNTNAVVCTRYECDSSGGAFTVTLPASPADNEWVWICDVQGSAATYPITIGRNGKNIQGLAADMDMDVAYGSCLLIYHASNGWVIR